jgi:hypothetical protein
MLINVNMSSFRLFMVINKARIQRVLDSSSPERLKRQPALGRPLLQKFF